MSMIVPGAGEARWTQMGQSALFPMHPPLRLFVEFFVKDEKAMRYGVTAQLGHMGTVLKCETVFVSLGVVGGEEKKEVFFDHQVTEWRETTNVRPAMLDYT